MFLHSPLINAGGDVSTLPANAYYAVYVKELISRPVGLNGEIGQFAQTYAISQDDNEVFHGEYRVYINDNKLDELHAAEQQIAELDEFKGNITYQPFDEL